MSQMFHLYLNYQKLLALPEVLLHLALPEVLLHLVLPEAL
jgi:hypothetical protein